MSVRRAELEAEQVKDAEHDVGVGAGVGHDFGRLQLGLLLEDDGEQDQAIAQRARDGDAVQPSELVGDEVVDRDPAFLTVVRVGAGMDGAQPVGRGDIATAPDAGEQDAVLRGDQGGFGARQRFGPDGCNSAGPN